VKKLLLLVCLLISVNSFGQTITLVCQGLEENTYEQLPERNEKHKDSREYKFVDGKLDGRYEVIWKPDEILYRCVGGSGNGCSGKSETSVNTDFREIRISRNSGEVTEYGSVKFGKKMNLSNTKVIFKGNCSKVEQKKF
jgi:hypothetical protein